MQISSTITNVSRYCSLLLSLLRLKVLLLHKAYFIFVLNLQSNYIKLYCYEVINRPIDLLIALSQTHSTYTYTVLSICQRQGHCFSITRCSKSQTAFLKKKFSSLTVESFITWPARKKSFPYLSLVIRLLSAISYKLHLYIIIILCCFCLMDNQMPKWRKIVCQLPK